MPFLDEAWQQLLSIKENDINLVQLRLISSEMSLFQKITVAVWSEEFIRQIQLHISSFKALQKILQLPSVGCMLLRQEQYHG